MSVELVKEQVFDFLKTKEAEVLAIKGRWGVGKTYAWEQYIQQCKNDIALKSYAYVSLFGVNSLSDIKKAVFENTIDTALIGESDNLATIKKNYKSLGKKIGRKSGSALKEFAKPASNLLLTGFGSSIDKAYESISFAMLSNTIICFDDLERHSKQVSIKDFLGLVSFFKEQKNCKVVILLNEDTKDLEEYLIYKEKVIDKQLHFEPTAEECFDIAIKEQDQYQTIKDICLRLDIRNIRVLKKIERHIHVALKVTQDYDNKIKSNIVQSIIILCWCNYCHSSDEVNIPNLSFIKKMHSKYVNRTDVKDDIYQKEWEQVLLNFNYLYSDPLSSALLKSVEQGFVDKRLLRNICQAKQNEIEIEKTNGLYSKGWDVYHHSFDANEKEVIEAMDKGLRSAVLNLTISQFSSGVGLIRDLGNESLAKELTEFYIEENKRNIEKLNVNNLDLNPFRSSDVIFSDTLQQYYDSHLKEDEPIDILERRSGQNSYNQSEIKVLEKLSSDDLKVLFKSFKGEELTLKIRACLMLAGSSKELMNNTRKALEDIGKESELNKQRLSKFNL